MSDIGARIRRYRLGRYGTSHDPLPRRMRWVWPFLGLWLVYVGFVSEHSVYRIWRLSAENARSDRQLATLHNQVESLDRMLGNSSAWKRVAEDSLRARGWAAPHEIVYRVGTAPAESLAR